MFFLIYILFNLLLVIILEIVEEIFENEHLGGGVAPLKLPIQNSKHSN